MPRRMLCLVRGSCHFLAIVTMEKVSGSVLTGTISVLTRVKCNWIYLLSGGTDFYLHCS